MASSSGKRTSSSGRTRKSTTSSRSRQAQRSAQDSELFHEIGLIVLFVAMLILFCCNFGIIGPVGNAISGVLFGIFGFTAYIAPIVIFLAVAFWFANEGNPTAVRKSDRRCRIVFNDRRDMRSDSEDCRLHGTV